MIFFYQFKVPSIKLGKCLAESMIPKPCLGRLAVKNLLRFLKSVTFEYVLAKRISYDMCTSRDTKEGKINNIKIKIIPFIIFFVETVSLLIDEFKSKKAAWDELCYFIVALPEHSIIYFRYQKHELS